MIIKRNSSTSQDGNQLSDDDDVNAVNFAVKHWKLREPRVILSMIDEDDCGQQDKTTLARIQDIASNVIEATSAAGIDSLE